MYYILLVVRIDRPFPSALQDPGGYSEESSPGLGPPIVASCSAIMCNERAAATTVTETGAHTNLWEVFRV